MRKVLSLLVVVKKKWVPPLAPHFFRYPGLANHLGRLCAQFRGGALRAHTISGVAPRWLLCVAILGSDVGQNRSENVGDHKLASDLGKNRSENSPTQLKTGRPEILLR